MQAVEFEEDAVADLANCASLFQLGAGVNLAAPAVSAALGEIERKVVMRFRDEYSRRNPAIELDDFATATLDECILGSHRNLKSLVAVLGFLPPVSILVTGISIVGLGFCATSPNSCLPDPAVWGYVWVALIALPLSYFAVRALAERLDGQILLNLRAKPEDVESLFMAFEALLPAKRAFADTDEILARLRVKSRLQNSRAGRWKHLWRAARLKVKVAAGFFKRSGQ